MKNLFFATQNKNKLKEVRSIAPAGFEIRDLDALNYSQDLKEDYNTLEENAAQKARTIHDQFRISVFADDTGLEVEALNGAPGVRSARYAGDDKSDAANVELLLKKLKGLADRSARFRTVIVLILDGKEYQFEGVVEGKIIDEKRGENGFGYDPIFIPKGHTKTFAQMSLSDKNLISHRKRALQKMMDFLESKDI